MRRLIPLVLGSAITFLSPGVAAAQFNDAMFVSQSVPSTLLPGQTATVVVRMENTGTTTWTPGAYFLGSQSPENNWTWGRARVDLDTPVAPGQRKNFTFTIEAPTAPGLYEFEWRMVQEYYEWFGENSTQLGVRVLAPTNGARFITFSVPPSFYPGETKAVSITMENTGTTTWTPSGNYFLGSQNPENNYNWGLNRVSVGSPVAPGQRKTFTFNVTALMTPDVYGFQWQMLQENVEWFGEKTPNLPTSVVPPANGARFISQSIPIAMTTGERATVSITMENTGGTTWTPSGNYFLGSQNPENNLRWGLNRVDLGGPVAPGQRKTFTFDITAPATQGTYAFQWRMLQELVEFFGDHTPNPTIAVVEPWNDARFVSQSVPNQLLPGASENVTVTIRNTGSSTWDSGAEFFLGSQSPENNWTWGLARAVLDHPVAPDQDATFRFSITAPEIPGPYEFQWRMVQERVEWFGEASPKVTVTVGRSNGADFVSQTVPTVMFPGDTADVSVTMTNTGASTWDPRENYFLGSVNPENNYTWGLNRVELDRPVPPGGVHTFHFTITAPTTVGEHIFQWRMVEELQEWFGRASIATWIATGSTDDNAEILSHTLPLRIVNRIPHEVEVTVSNTGFTTWSRLGDGPGDGSQGFKLGVKGGDLIPIGTRFELPPEAEVEPGESFTFHFSIEAPFQDFATTELSMLHEGVGWFGQSLQHSVVIDQTIFEVAEIHVSPAGGPPGTLVEVHHESGFLFHPLAKVKFHFGEPLGHDYAEVPVVWTRVSETLMTFTVPSNVACGIHFVSVWLPTERLSESVGFTVESPCDPGPRASLDVLSYNIALLPFGQNAPWGPTNTERVINITYHQEIHGHDVIIFQEAFSDSHRQLLRDRLRDEYPHQSGILGEDDGVQQDGGVFIVSKWPIQAEAQTHYGPCSGDWPLDDDVDCIFVKKGAKYARIDKGGQIYHIVGTHTDAGDDEGDRNARLGQLIQMFQFMTRRPIRVNEPVIMGGDFNIDFYGPHGEYARMLGVLDATHPPVLGFPYSNVKDQLLDYVLYWNRAIRPSSASNEIKKFPYPWEHNFLSDHFAVLGRFRFPLGQARSASCAGPPTEAPTADAPLGTVGSALPTFTWNAADGADWYSLDVFRAQDDAHLVHESGVAGTSLLLDSPIPAGEPLYWSVRGNNACGSGPSTSFLPFEVEFEDGSPPAAAPTPNWPGGIISDPRPSFSWGPVEGATSYDLVALRGDDEGLVIQQEVSGTSFQPDAALPVDVPLEWAVSGVNPAGAGPYSTSTAFEIRVPAENQPPTVTVSHTGSCSVGCAVTFTASAGDPDGDPLSFNWTGCGSGIEDQITCSASQSGEVQVSVVVSDGKGGEATAWATVSIYAAAWEPGSWGSCTGTGEWTCTSGAADGCSRPGTETRKLAETAWSLDPGTSPPETERACTETSQGYAAAYTTGPWSRCSKSCGGGMRARKVTVSAWKATSPAAPAPPKSQACNTQRCGLTCYDYPDTYPTRPVCLAAGWPVCERRFRDDGLGGMLTCWKGFN